MAIYDDYFKSASDAYGRAAENAIPTRQSVETASDRLRSRLATTQNANAQALSDKFAGRGLSNSGLHDSAQRQNIVGTQSAYASGLGDLEADYQKRVGEGAKTLADIGSGYGQLGQGFGQLGINQQAANNESQDVANKYKLGLGDLARRAEATQADLFGKLGQYGNTQFDNPETQRTFEDIIRQLFGSSTTVNPGDPSTPAVPRQAPQDPRPAARPAVPQGYPAGSYWGDDGYLRLADGRIPQTPSGSPNYLYGDPANNYSYYVGRSPSAGA